MKATFLHLFFWVALLGPSAARGEDIASQETARALYAEATRLVATGATREALAKFEGAYAATPTPIIGLGWARAHEALGELVEARDRAINASQLPLQRAETQRSAAARQDLERLAADLAKRIPRVTFLVGTSETALELSLAGVPIKRALLGQPLFRNPGSYELVATCGKAQLRKALLELQPSGQREMDLSLLAAACTKRVAPTKGRSVSEGLIVGGAVTFVPYIALPPGDIPTSSKFSATAGLTGELGYAISPTFLLLLRGLVSFGPQGNPTYLVSAGPTLMFRVAEPVWVSLSFHGGRAQTEFTNYAGKFTSDYVFGTQFGVEVPFIERESTYWYAGAGAGVLIANLIAKDTPFFFTPISLGVRTF
jgi:hypothetical protein